VILLIYDEDIVSTMNINALIIFIFHIVFNYMVFHTKDGDASNVAVHAAGESDPPSPAGE
jgi:hypothetical protein